MAGQSANSSQLVSLLLLACLLSNVLAQQAQPGPQLGGLLESLRPNPAATDDDEYLVGFGISDITGPSADINLMGYAKPNQDAGGIHLRQFCRSLVIIDRRGTKLAYASLDNGMVSQLLRTRVMERLGKLLGPGNFNESNVMISSTHTHSTPGGHFQYMLYNIPSAGYIAQTLEALVDGVGRCVQRAYNNLQPARLRYHKGQLLGASVNRSPTSYQNNPQWERNLYAHDTDKEMFLIRADNLQGQPIGVVNWFAVHGTSMNNTNHLISSDNKGYAALLLERELNGAASLPGRGQFVAIFAQANEGDVSPNTRGPRCVDTGLPCDQASSTCGNPPRNEKCIAFGPGEDMFESTKIIAYKQYYKARELFLDTANQRPISGPLRFVHEYIDVTRQRVPPYESMRELAQRRPAVSEPSQQQVVEPSRGRTMVSRSDGAQERPSPDASSSGQQQNGTFYETCVASLGYSFAAGTTDGPGAFDFQQGDTESSRYWNMVRNFLRKPSPELIKCQHPKPILLATGEMDFPYMWHPKIVPTQLFMLGRQVALVGLPGEFTTMSGRRVRQAVLRALSNPSQEGPDFIGQEVARHKRATNSSLQAGGQQHQQQVEVVLSGLSNIYTSYVTTVEEYEVQRYEGASTLYGPHTLQAYVNQFARLARVLAASGPSAAHSFELTQAGLQPPDLSKSLFTLKPGVLFDGAPHGRHFGDLLADVDRERVYKSRELVGAAFVAGNPRNDLKQEESFLYVDLFQPQDGSWSTVATDANWETKFIWERTNTLFGESKATCQWEIPDDCQSGVYRIRHQGAHKTLLQTINHYEGRSAPFKVLCTNHQLDQNAQVVQLEAAHKLAEQVEAQAAAIRDLVSRRPVARVKSDQRQGGSLFGGLRNRLSSLFGLRS